MRVVSPIAVVVGAAGSLALMLRDHLHSPPVLLVLFTGWMLLPFVALLFAQLVFSTRWLATTRAVLYSAMLVLTVVSLAVYGVAVFGLRNTQQTFVFLAVPFGSWVLISIAAGIAAIAGRR